MILQAFWTDSGIGKSGGKRGGKRGPGKPGGGSPAGRSSPGQTGRGRHLAAAFAGCILLAPSFIGAALAADPSKVLRISFPTQETGFDPVRVSDLYSNTVNEAIFERLLTYDYLASPAKLAPSAAEAMPEVSADGKTYTFKIRSGVYFTPDPAFKDKKRELTAQDFVYSYMRFMDPKWRSPYGFMIEGKVVGLDDLATQAKKTGKFDYDAKIPGLEAYDRYTLKIRLNEPDINFPYVTAHVPYGAVAREVIEANIDDTMGHPVGTGPYFLKEWTRGNKIVLEANPGYRGFVWDFKALDKWDEGVVAAMKGKRMPQIGRVEISIIEEEQSRWLAFQQKQLGYLNMPSTFIPQALDAANKLQPALAAEGITLYRTTDLDITYTMFNMRDPVVGGYTPEKTALRRAMIMGYNIDEQINIIRKKQAVKTEMPVPPGVVGHSPNYRSLNQYDPELANKLLDHYGYKKGADGYRRLPDGKPLVVKYATGSSAIEREYNELWKKSMDAIGIRLDFVISKFSDHLKAAKACQLMLWGAAWSADYPDGDNFMQLLYGPNVGQSNNGCYESKAFDSFYEKAKYLPADSPERNRLFLEMSRQMEVDGAWSLHDTRARNQLIQPWVKGYKKHPILNGEWLYMDLDPRT